MNELEASPPDAATLWDEQELSKRTGIAPSTLQKQRMRGDGKLAAFASVGLIAFTAVRSASLHQVDALLGIRLLGLSANAAIENAAIIVIALCAAIASRRVGKAAQPGLARKG